MAALIPDASTPGLDARAERPREPVMVDPSGEAARRLAALARWRRRSRQVRFFRVALPWAMAGLLALGIGWMVVRNIIAGLEGRGESVGTIHLLHPVFYGRNDRGERYVMAAEEAVRNGDDPNRIALTLPRLRQYTGAPQPQIVTADRGVYLEKQRLLDLFDHVRATDGQDNHFASGFAHVDLPRNLVTGNSAMTGYGPSGTTAADAYTIYDKGQHIVLTGHVRVHLINVRSDHAKPGGPPAAKAPAPAAGTPASGVARPATGAVTPSKH